MYNTTDKILLLILKALEFKQSKWLLIILVYEEDIMNNVDIDRINELYHKSKSVGLTKAEEAEQKKLRKAYLSAIRKNLRGSLNRIDIQNEDGSIENLGEKYGKKLDKN